ncbi:MAG: sialidase family protein [Kiritimatiellaeota bacterium]|nr:sialidase family protein [Kiritimatiellota bacterium]
MSTSKFLRAESDCIVGKRRRLERFLICSTQGYFPVLVRTGRQSLAVILRTGGTHVSASATLAVSTSKDGGKCWSDPVQITPRWEDSRNPAFGVNAKGDLLAAYWKASMDCYVDTPNGLQWKNGLKVKGKVPTMFVRRSADNGRTWSKEWAYKSELLTLPSPYGRIIAAPDGTLLMPVYGTSRKKRKGVNDISILLRSRDGGKTWGDESLVAVGHNETSYTFLPGGRLLAVARCEVPYSDHVATLFSDDGGRTWSKPVPVTRRGEHPADLTVLASGALQLTFGRRIRPMGCGVLFSADGGTTWDTDHEVLLAGDGIRTGDLGYPSTVQLADGTIVTALYYASGSDTVNDWGGWGDVSCQAIRYREEDIRA